jgi:hypothetical protein
MTPNDLWSATALSPIGGYQAGNVLRAVPVPGKDRKDDRALDAGCLRRTNNLSDQLAVIDNLGAAPKLEPPAVCVVHQEQKRAVVRGEMANADVLPVARIFGKGEGPLVGHFDEASEAATVLDVRLPLGARRRQIGRVPLADESNDVCGESLRKTSRGGATRIGVARAAACLFGAHRSAERLQPAVRIEHLDANAGQGLMSKTGSRHGRWGSDVGAITLETFGRCGLAWFWWYRRRGLAGARPVHPILRHADRP